ncbi:hypothetical protein ACF0H5_017768 [Mactra antiquata]
MSDGENGTTAFNMNDTDYTYLTSTVKTYEQIEADKVRKLMAQIETYVCPTLFLAGIVGNTCVILTVTHPKFRKMGSRIILCALAISDSLLLSTNPFNQQFMQSWLGVTCSVNGRHDKYRGNQTNTSSDENDSRNVRNEDFGGVWLGPSDDTPGDVTQT